MEKDLENVKNEVLRKIGRNVILYQQLEVMLKLLVSNGNIAGYVCELQLIKEQQKEKVMRQTLGHVAGQFLENTYREHQELDEDFPELSEKKLHVSFSYKIQADEECYQRTKENLAKIVQERNDLIHHFILNYNLNSVDSLLEAEQYLDAKREALLPEHENVKQYLKALDEGRKELAAYIASDEFMRQWRLADLRDEYVVKLLGRIIEVAKRTDGWTLLSHAGQLLQQNAPDQFRAVKSKYNCRTLKKLIEKTEIFDLMEERTAKNGERSLYRLKDGWRYDTNQLSS